jgi:hypothetical protein
VAALAAAGSRMARHVPNAAHSDLERSRGAFSLPVLLRADASTWAPAMTLCCSSSSVQAAEAAWADAAACAVRTSQRTQRGPAETPRRRWPKARIPSDLSSANTRCLMALARSSLTSAVKERGRGRSTSVMAATAVGAWVITRMRSARKTASSTSVVTSSGVRAGSEHETGGRHDLAPRFVEPLQTGSWPGAAASRPASPELRGGRPKAAASISAASVTSQLNSARPKCP